MYSIISNSILSYLLQKSKSQKGKNSLVISLISKSNEINLDVDSKLCLISYQQ